MRLFSFREGLFSKISNRWRVQVDLFASKWNAQLPIFVSWRPQPNSWRVNAFNLSWSSLMGYAFPTFSLILRCLTEIRRERAQMVFDNPGVAESTVVTNNPGTCERGSRDHPPESNDLAIQSRSNPSAHTDGITLPSRLDVVRSR